MSRRTRLSGWRSPPRGWPSIAARGAAAQTGHELGDWPRVIVKELVDNGLDHCEEVGIAPVIKVTITTGKRGKLTRIVVADNGRGVPSATVAGIIITTCGFRRARLTSARHVAARVTRSRPSCL